MANRAVSISGLSAENKGPSQCQYRLVDEVLEAAAGGRLTIESALRLIFAIRKVWKKGHVWWKRTAWAEKWHVHKTTITRDYEQWTALGFVKRRPNPFKASATLLIFPWSPVWVTKSGPIMKGSHPCYRNCVELLKRVAIVQPKKVALMQPIRDFILYMKPLKGK
jgi:hypothetical protein